MFNNSTSVFTTPFTITNGSVFDTYIFTNEILSGAPYIIILPHPATQLVPISFLNLTSSTPVQVKDDLGNIIYSVAAGGQTTFQPLPSPVNLVWKPIIVSNPKSYSLSPVWPYMLTGTTNNTGHIISQTFTGSGAGTNPQNAFNLSGSWNVTGFTGTGDALLTITLPFPITIYPGGNINIRGVGSGSFNNWWIGVTKGGGQQFQITAAQTSSIPDNVATKLNTNITEPIYGVTQVIFNGVAATNQTPGLTYFQLFNSEVNG